MIKLRTATVNDAPMLSKIYEYYVKNTTISFEYDAPSASEFAERIEHKLEKYPFIVAEENGKAVGYAYASEYRERRAYDHSVELSIYVDRDEHHCGIGTALYTALFALLKEQNFASAYSCITIPNSPSVCFHEDMGFSLIGYFHRAGFKHGSWLDVSWYERPISDYSTPPQPIIPFPALDPAKVEEIYALATGQCKGETALC